ncbi:MAG: hypothetical protein ACK51L_04790 [bacterium]
MKDHCRNRNIEMIVIPGGLTPYLQAGDIGIYREFKDKLSDLIDRWKNSDGVQYTRGGIRNHQLMKSNKHGFEMVGMESIYRISSHPLHPQVLTRTTYNGTSLSMMSTERASYEHGKTRGMKWNRIRKLLSRLGRKMTLRRSLGMATMKSPFRF